MSEQRMQNSSGTADELGNSEAAGASNAAASNTAGPVATSNEQLPQNVTPAALRALAEAEERRRQQSENEANRPPEVGGRNGPDPIRFGDWEKGGIASDF